MSLTLLTEPDASAPPAWYALLVALLTLIKTLEARIADLQTRIADLEARLNQHSVNFSKPPSSDPPDAPPKPRRATRAGS